MRRLIILFTLIFLFVLALDLYPGLRGGSGWQWAYEVPENWAGVFALAGVLVIYLLGVYVLRCYFDTRAWINLLWSFLGAGILGIAVVGTQGHAGFHLFTRTVSPVQTGASTVAVQIMARDGVQPTLENWTDVMRFAGDANIIHFTTSPPGQVLAHYGLANFFSRVPLSEQLSLSLRPYQCSNPDIMWYTRGEIISAGIGMLMPFFAALTVFPLFFVGKALTNDKATALHIIHWWALIPTVLMFAPTWNTLYPFLCLSVFALLFSGLRSESTLRFGVFCVLAGLVMSITTFLNFAVLPILLFIGLFTLGYGLFIRSSENNAYLSRLLWAVRAGIYFGLGLASVWVLFYLASGLTPLDIWQVTVDEHAELVQRDYLPWLILHPYDVLLFVGWCVAGLFLWGTWHGYRDMRNTRQITSLHLIAFAMLATLSLVNLSGIAQGENARILSFYAPFLLLSGIVLFKSRWWDFSLLATQGLVVLVMASVLPVVPLDLNPMPTAPREDLPTFDFLELRPVEATFASNDFAGEFTLDSHRFIADLAQQTITVEIHWRGIERTERPYHFEIIAFAENDTDGAIQSEPFRWLPQNGNYLTNCWSDGDLIRDVVTIPLPPISEPVVWTLALTAIDERTGDIAGMTTLDPVNYP